MIVSPLSKNNAPKTLIITSHVEWIPVVFFNLYDTYLLRETTSRGRCGLVRPSRTSELSSIVEYE